MSTINIHEYPTDDEIIPHYRAAVMLAAADGAHVEYANPGEIGWYRTGYPAWDWTSFLYRIAAPKIAKGHNPDGLSESRVDVNGGWRLLQDSEIYGEQFRADIETWDAFCEEWLNGDWCGNDTTATYRTKKPEGYFLPKPEVPLADMDKQACDKTLRAFAEGESMAGYTFRCGWMEALKYERSRAK